MRLNISSRIKVFVIAVSLIIAGQIVFTAKNISSFQNSYLETLRTKCQKLGEFIKNDVEYVLNLNIPLNKLIRIEQSLKDILNAAPELDCIEISDINGRILYHADHTSMKNMTDTDAFVGSDAELLTKRFKELGFSQNQMETWIPVYFQAENRQVGNILLRLSTAPIAAKSREILMDMITVILTSLLITFEFLSLFVAFSISGPLEKIVGEMEEAIFQLRPLFSRGGLLMPELNHIVARFDCFLEAYLSRIRPFVVLQQWFMQAVHIISPYITDHIKSIDAVTASLSDSIDKGISKKTLQQSMQKFETILRALQDRLISLSSQLSLIGFDTTKYNDIGALHKSQKSIPYIYIRPLIFLIVMSDSFCESFFPIYVNTLYQPFWGLSREIVLGIPISLYMLVFAVSILLSGIWSEKVGWNKLLVAGGFLNALGLIAVPISVHFLQLMVLRSLSALGVGLFFMGCQRFIVDNTDADTRAQGMATFASAFFSGSICGTVIGGMLADKIGYGNVFYISGFISFLTLYFVFVLFPFSSHKASHNTPQRKILKDLIQVIKDKEFSAVVLLQAIPAKIALIGYLSYFVPLYLKKIGILQSNIARVAMCYGLAMVFLGPIFTKYLDRQRHRKYHMIAGGVVSGLSMTIYYFYSGFEPTLFAVIMLGVAHTVSVSSQASLISETNVVKAVGVGIGLGLFRFWERLGNVLGPIVMGFLIAKTDYETSAIVLGALSLISSCVYILLQIYWKRRSVKIMR